MKIEELHEWADDLDWNHIEDGDDDINEHYYVVSDWYEDEDLEKFRRFRTYINAHGDTQFYNGSEFQYVYIDGWKYWLSQSYYSKGVCLNRRQEDQEPD